MTRLHSAGAAAGILSLSLVAGLALPTEAAAQAALVNALQRIERKLDAQVVPFKVMVAGGLCDSAGDTTSNPLITIDSSGSEGEFVVTSVLLKTVAPGIPETGFRNLALNSVLIDGERFDTRSGNLLGPADGSGVLESGDILGTPVRRSGDMDAPVVDGARVPHQVVAESAGSDDVQFELFCSTTDEDLSFDMILVAGWKRPADTVTVTFTPGS